MIIFVNDAMVVNGQEGTNYAVSKTSSVTMIPQCDEERNALEQFISQHTPHIEEEYDEEYAPGLPEPPED